jgi:hypothetical protein
VVSSPQYKEEKGDFCVSKRVLKGNDDVNDNNNNKRRRQKVVKWWWCFRVSRSFVVFFPRFTYA